MLHEFLNKIKSKEAVVGIIGLGYVGLPLMLRFAEEGYRVLGFDIDDFKNQSINMAQSYIKHISSSKIAAVKHLLYATSDFSQTKEVDAIILCVPTPLNKYREPDLSFVMNSVDKIIPYLRKGQLVSLESTTYPGTTAEEIKPRIEKSGLTIGQDIFLIYSPEREDPGNINFSTAKIPKICGGDTSTCTQAGIALYSAVIEHVISVSSTRVAEITKLLENIHRSVNIGLVNEMKMLTDKMGIDIFEVIDAAATKPFGFVPYYPGPGIGGHCIPIDPFYLTWKAREFGMHTRFIELAGEINNNMPNWVVSKILEALNEKERTIKNSNILILGLAYKQGVDDIRESPSIEIMELLKAKRALIAYSDPHVPVFPKMRAHYFSLRSEKLAPQMLQSYDCVVLTTAHQEFDYPMIAENARLIIDTRGVFRSYKHQKNIISA